jgi:hypothetical protein
VEKLRDAREGSPYWPANGGEFEAIMFGRGVFLKGKNFHSVVIVVPLHVSKFSRVLKKLTAYLGTRSVRIIRVFLPSIGVMAPIGGLVEYTPKRGLDRSGIPGHPQASDSNLHNTNVDHSIHTAKNCE